MTTFKERENAFERKFVLDEETKFKIDMRCMTALGEWAAVKLGLSGRNYEAYIAAIRKGDIIGDEASVIEKIKGDFLTRRVGCTEREIREFIATARVKAEDEICRQP